MSAAAVAEERRFNIAEDSAGAGITEFARQSGLQILVAQAALANKRTRAVQGVLEVREALKQLLEDSGLVIRSESARAIILGAAPPQQILRTPDPSAATLPARQEVRLDEVIVTAERREQILQKTPMSVSVVAGEDIEQMGRHDVMDVLRNVPGVQVKIAQPSPLLAIRGLGTVLPPNVTENAVAVNYDGVATTLPLNTLGFFDLNRVEVLRGPQGTLYGRNATAGVINLISNDPVLNAHSSKASFEAGNYGLYRVETAANLPISDRLAMRTALVIARHSDYYENNRKRNNFWGLRSKLLFQPTDDFSLLLTAEFSASNDPERKIIAIPYTYWLAGDYYRNQDRLEHEDSSLSEIRKFYGKLNWSVGPGQLTLTPGYFKEGAYTAVNFDGVQAPQRRQVLPRKQNSYELRYSAQAESAMQWAFGYFHFYALERGTTQLASGVRLADGSQLLAPDGYGFLCSNPAPAAISECQLQPLFAPGGVSAAQLDARKTEAVFGQISYPLSDRWQVLGGLRSSRDIKRAYDMAGVLQRAITHHVDWRVGLQYDLSSASMLYGTLASAYRPGGINPLSAFNPSGTSVVFDKETVTALEVGAKNYFLNDRLLFNAALYRYRYRDYQANDFYEINGGPMQGGGVVSIIYNVPSVRIDGAELEVQSLLTRRDRINLALAYNEANIVSDFFWHPGGISNAVNYRGRPLTQAARWNAVFGYQHDFALSRGRRITPRLDYRYVSGQYLSLNQQAPGLYSEHANSYSPAHATGDLSLVYQPASERWDLSLYVKNFTNKIVIVGWQEGPNLLSLDSPRTFGGVLTLNY